MNVTVRSMSVDDVGKVKALIEKTILDKSMEKIYESRDMTIWNDCYDESELEHIAREYRTYLLFDDSNRLVASGYVKEDGDGNAYIGMVFSDPDARGAGLGKKMIELLEADECVKGCKKIEIIASMSAFRFYRKLGYDVKDGEYEMHSFSGVYGIPMEKFLNL